MARKRGGLSFPPGDYFPDALRRYSDKELRREYSRLRAIARKRLDVFSKSEFRDSAAYQYNKGRYVPLSKVQSSSELRLLLTDVSRFILAEAGTVSGQRRIRKKAIETFERDWGIKITPSEYNDFLRFLEFVKDTEGYAYDLKDVKEVWERYIDREEDESVIDIESLYEAYMTGMI